MEPKVFVTQEQPHINYAQAEDYGEVIFASIHDMPTIHTSLRGKEAVAEIAKSMSPYRSGIDYVLPTGSPLNIASVMLLIGRMGNVHNILKWDNRAKKYTKVILETPEVV